MTDSSAGTGGGPDEGEVTVDERPRDAVGVWPRWWKKFWEDFKSAKRAKANDGLQAPAFPDIEWAEEPSAGTEVILEAARRRLEQAEGRTQKAEERADRLVQRGLSLIALIFLIVGFVATRLRVRDVGPGWWLVGLAAPGTALVFLGLCVLQALGVDRVGFVAPAEPEPAAKLSGSEQIRNLVAQEARATQMANWSAHKKVNEVLDARASLSRGAAALLVAATVMVVVWVQGVPEADQPARSTTTTVVSGATTTSPQPTTTVNPSVTTAPPSTSIGSPQLTTTTPP